MIYLESVHHQKTKLIYDQQKQVSNGWRIHPSRYESYELQNP